MNSKQFPLQWPMGRARNQNPERSKFKPGSIYAEAQAIFIEIERMGGTEIIISSNMQYRADGLPYTRQNVHDTGVAVYFKLDGKEQCIPCDQWITLEENMRAIWKTIEAMRGIERWGGKQLMDVAFSGFAALPEAIIMGAPDNREWWKILGLAEPTKYRDEVERAYKRKAKEAHPDAGGDAVAFIAISKAYEEGLGQCV